jgi:hypothetical protein
VVEILTVAAVVLAWLTFRYARHRSEQGAQATPLTAF